MAPHRSFREANLRRAREPVRDHLHLKGLFALVTTTVALTGLVVLLVVPHEGETDMVAIGAIPGSAVGGHGNHQDAGAAPTATGEPAPPMLATQLATATTVAAQWPTAAAALADGWTLAEDYASQVGAHYMRYDEIDDVFDAARPEMLLYGGDAPDSPIVGLAYYVINREPDGFVGSEDIWHQHPNVCIGPDGPLWGADGVGICAHDAESPVGNWAWMLHAWVIPVWQSPQGVFSSVNLALP